MDLRTRHETAYEFQSWRAAPADASPEPRDFVPRASAGLKLDRSRPHFDSYHARRVIQYRFTADGEPSPASPVLQVIVAECASPEAARLSAMDVLAGTMAKTLGRDRDGHLRLGELAFTPSCTPPPYVMFVRGTLMVQVRSIGRVEVSVVAAAQELDRQITSG